ncbi:similar to Saccharomyces cerevisiae YLR229C CDC42 Small rho-like GTPase [Geotrichum candidum]|uniref:Similar to Saccharomyces cerevisiae YLR229C CDC42 Small rho-like GTPase n=1 Tax=Geotrichum candidum TaxID=1173061 RepID=A0A0J9XIP4_GEOCN|nr:similar to Saccharomyces cerevisiae YLR229C CDC42 Small rho-like GTPase [Geotrichum candidum]
MNLKYTENCDVNICKPLSTSNLLTWASEILLAQEDYDSLCPLSYSQTGTFLICFSLESLLSFENVKSSGTGRSPIKHQTPHHSHCLQCAKEINTVKYPESLVLMQKGLKGVFDEAIYVFLEP